MEKAKNIRFSSKRAGVHQGVGSTDCKPEGFGDKGKVRSRKSSSRAKGVYKKRDQGKGVGRQEDTLSGKIFCRSHKA